MSNGCQYLIFGKLEGGQKIEEDDSTGPKSLNERFLVPDQCVNSQQNRTSGSPSSTHPYAVRLPLSAMHGSMVTVRRLLVLAALLVPALAAGQKQMWMRKVLPLDHHQRYPPKYHRVLPGHHAGSGRSQDTRGEVIEVGSFDNGDGISEGHSQDSRGSTIDRAKGFLGEGFELMQKGRAAESHVGGSEPGNSHPGNSHGVDHPAPVPKQHKSNNHYVNAPILHQKSKMETPTLSPVLHPSPSGHVSKSKSKSASKSKGKGGKGSKGRGKGKGGATDMDGNGPINGEGTMGGDTMAPGTDDMMMPSGVEMPATLAPMEQDIFELTPFGILYDLEGGVGTPSSEEYGMAIEITVGYLNTYMSLQYEGQGLIDFQTEATSTIYKEGVPQIDFSVTATFEADARISKERLDETVGEAFAGANLALYLSMLQNLPSTNAFSTVSGARLTNPAGTARSGGLIGSVSTVGKAGIAGAIGAGGLILAALGVLVYSNHQKQERRAPIVPGIGCARSTNHQQRRDYNNHSRRGGKVNLENVGQDESDESTTIFEATTTCSDTLYSEFTARSGISMFFSEASLPISLKRTTSMPMSLHHKATLDSGKETLGPHRAEEGETATGVVDGEESATEAGAVDKAKHMATNTVRLGMTAKVAEAVIE